ncbi:putative phosphoribosylaminoimidazole-succinocarboxamide synthase [Xylariaceae sp. FL0255]|nr:putative phosphoribosylaminoimidazole-succinocarboxamide synthase [Xylariaceae sp. FL0255]
MAANVVTSISLRSLPKVGSGKVRELFDVDDNTLLVVTSDRISAFDIVMRNGIPLKGALLTMLSKHWFTTHFITTDLPAGISYSDSDIASLSNRSMQVQRYKIFPLECIVRGHLAGSAWKEYVAQGTAHSILLLQGLTECAAIPGGPIYTPSTKAPDGQHDKNIHPDEAIKVVGKEYAQRIEKLELNFFQAGRDYAARRGIIIADTKFEFGLDKTTDEIILIDEVFTPDSSRMWTQETYKPGQAQKSLDKQPLRDWLVATGLDGKERVEIPDTIAREISQRYKDVFTILTGETRSTK